MGSIPDHKAHHDDPEDLPLLTESARVVDVTALDENRTDEVRAAAAHLLEAVDRPDLVEQADPPHVDWDGVERFLEGSPGGPRAEQLSALMERYHRPYPSLLSVGLHESEEPIDFVPGQYVTLRFDRTPRPYSLACSPNADHLECCIRRVPGGRLTSDLFETLEPGDEVVVRGPNGDFVMEDTSKRDVAFLATGTGVAPLRSMIEFIFEENLDEADGASRDVWLFLGCSWRDDLPYADEFRDLAEEHDNFHFVPTLSREPILTDWTGETAYVQQTLVKYLADDVVPDLPDRLAGFLDREPATDVEARIDPASLEVYACGVSAMVQTLEDVATWAGVPDQHVHGEGFG